MERFLESIAQAFARNRGSLPGALRLLAAVVVAALVVQAVAALRRWRRRATLLRQVAAQRGLGPEDVRFVQALAARSGASALQVLTHLDLFERATAAVLSEGDRARGGAEAARARIRHVRHALGFDRLPVHAPLLTSRELAPGTAVEASSRHGQVAAVDEASFTVELLSADLAPAPGPAVELALTHAREARYLLHCPVLEARRQPGAWQLVLGHDEAPVRLQRREYARVAVNGPVLVRPVAVLVTHAGVAREWLGVLVDVGGGGARVATRTPLPVGMLGLASFSAGDAHFSALRAVVLASERTVDGLFQAHLEFGRIPEPERERLVAAVARLERDATRGPQRAAT